jgi:hypothetical protein
MAIPKEPKADIERVRADFRTGQFTNRELAAAHGISESYVRKVTIGLQKDLSARVREAVRSETVRCAVRAQGGTEAPTDEEIVARAAECGAQAVTRHGRIAGKGVEGAEHGVDEALAALEEIRRSELPKTQIARMQRSVATTKALEALGVAMRILAAAVTIERQALNIDDKDGDDDPENRSGVSGLLAAARQAGSNQSGNNN